MFIIVDQQEVVSQFIFLQTERDRDRKEPKKNDRKIPRMMMEWDTRWFDTEKERERDSPSLFWFSSTSLFGSPRAVSVQTHTHTHTQHSDKPDR